MKAIHFFPPTVALVIAGAWLGSQRQSIATLEQQSTRLRKEIADKRSAVIAMVSDLGRGGRMTKENGAVDWKKLAAQWVGAEGYGTTAEMRFRNELRFMDKDELVAALDEIASLDLADESRIRLEKGLIGRLGELDPEFALKKYSDHIKDQPDALARALGNWALKDPGAAAAWFDQQIAAGKFESESLDGKSQSRIAFESAIISVLFSSQPDAVALRIAALPQDQRSEILQSHHFTYLKKEDLPACAKLVRQFLPEEEQRKFFTRFASHAVAQGYSDSDLADCMNRIGATPAERAACQIGAGKVKVSYGISPITGMETKTIDITE